MDLRHSTFVKIFQIFFSISEQHLSIRRARLCPVQRKLQSTICGLGFSWTLWRLYHLTCSIRSQTWWYIYLFFQVAISDVTFCSGVIWVNSPSEADSIAKIGKTRSKGWQVSLFMLWRKLSSRLCIGTLSTAAWSLYYSCGHSSS